MIILQALVISDLSIHCIEVIKHPDDSRVFAAEVFHAQPISISHSLLDNILMRETKTKMEQLMYMTMGLPTSMIDQM